MVEGTAPTPLLSERVRQQLILAQVKSRQHCYFLAAGYAPIAALRATACRLSRIDTTRKKSL